MTHQALWGRVWTAASPVLRREPKGSTVSTIRKTKLDLGLLEEYRTLETTSIPTISQLPRQLLSESPEIKRNINQSVSSLSRLITPPNREEPAQKAAAKQVTQDTEQTAQDLTRIPQRTKTRRNRRRQESTDNWTWPRQNEIIKDLERGSILGSWPGEVLARGPQAPATRPQGWRSKESSWGSLRGHQACYTPLSSQSHQP